MFSSDRIDSSGIVPPMLNYSRTRDTRPSLSTAQPLVGALSLWDIFYILEDLFFWNGLTQTKSLFVLQRNFAIKGYYPVYSIFFKTKSQLQ
jgi:hypothetical protein